ncbi:hypothetical protein RRG08_004146 [Elysia crispata]|uniref:Uncharacterized protein n=1 Tax=Elysia crispata TaxID=231223 RepID=A0AAE1D691_9GAST|nr:hypothetical protein RRG08_004146 [Elysia crispata]
MQVCYESEEKAKVKDMLRKALENERCQTKIDGDSASQSLFPNPTPSCLAATLLGEIKRGASSCDAFPVAFS